VPLKKNKIKEEFDERAAIYENWRLGDWYKAHSDIALKLLPNGFSGALLDIGCGSGYFCRKVAEHFPDAKVFGIDLSPNMAKEAKNLVNEAKSPNLSFSNVEFLNLDFEESASDCPCNSNFDYIFCLNTFHYFANPERALKKMRDCLNTEGKLVLLDRNAKFYSLTRFWGWLHSKFIKDGAVFRSDNEIIRMIKTAGYSNCRITERINRLFWKGKITTNIVILEAIK